MRWLILTAVALAMMFSPLPTNKVVAATNVNSWRCDLTKQIVKLGDTAGQVFHICGEPDSIVEIGSGTSTRFGARATPRWKGGVKVKGSSTSVTVEGYIYEYYNSRLPVRITVIGGRVTTISVGDY